MNFITVRLWAVGMACCLGFFIAFSSAAAVENAASPLGINMREIRYWGTEIPTVDFFKRASNGENGLWLTQCTGNNCWNTREQGQLDLDAAGWPRSLPAADSSSVRYRFVSTIIVMNTDKFPAGRWTVFYDGEGTLSYGGDAVRNAAASTPGRDAFDVAQPRSGFILSIVATDPQRTGNYLRNIRVIPPGGTCNGDPFAYAADASACSSGVFRPFTDTYLVQPFHPQFLSDMRPFSALRYVHFTNVIQDQTVNWKDRPQYSNISWGYDSPLYAGAPLEAALDMANALDASPWLEIPARANDDYVTQFARLAKTRLTTTRPIYLEYYNEVWNGAYPYNINAQWIQQQGAARWPSSPIQNFDKGINWFGMRTKEICDIWKREFADQPGRIHCVMGGWAGNSWVTDQALSCPLYAAEPGGSACDATAGIEATTIAPYIGGHVADPVFQTQIETTWFTESDGGLSKLFQEISQGGVLVPPNPNMAMTSLPVLRSMMSQNKTVADRHGVELLVYEGGNELVGRGSDAYQTRLQNLFVQANRDSRMGEVYTTLLDDWKALGGSLFMVYESTGAYSTSRGNSTLLEWQGQPSSQAPKYAAVEDFIATNPCWWDGCQAASYSLTVSKSGKGAGNISSNPAGIDCGNACSALFAGGTVVALTASPASRSRFLGWSGACAGKGKTCTLTMDNNRQVTATFKAQ